MVVLFLLYRFLCLGFMVCSVFSFVLICFDSFLCSFGVVSGVCGRGSGVTFLWLRFPALLMTAPLLSVPPRFPSHLQHRSICTF